jgi:hypothetical protein
MNPKNFKNEIRMTNQGRRTKNEGRNKNCVFALIARLGDSPGRKAGDQRPIGAVRQSIPGLPAWAIRRKFDHCNPGNARTAAPAVEMTGALPPYPRDLSHQATSRVWELLRQGRCVIRADALGIWRLIQSCVYGPAHPRCWWSQCDKSRGESGGRAHPHHNRRRSRPRVLNVSDSSGLKLNTSNVGCVPVTRASGPCLLLRNSKARCSSSAARMGRRPMSRWRFHSPFEFRHSNFTSGGAQL